MAAGRNCLIITFPFTFTVAALVLVIFVLLGNLTANGILSKLYFLRVNISDLKIEVDGQSYAISDNALPDFYQAGIWNYCQGTISDNVYNVTSCTKSKGLFAFNPISIIEDQLDVVISNLPSNVSDALNTAKKIGNAIVVLYCASAIFFVFEFISGFFAFHSRGGSCCTMIFGLIAAALIIASSGLATGFSIVLRNAFQDNVSFFGITSQVNYNMIVLTWASAVAAIVAAIMWLFSIFCGSTRYSSRRTEKEFVYAPVEAQPYGVR
ncbi:actin cortical patch SUR7/pH-response regulator pali [Lipomyces japonicus]|uniref:actin cortical patch SUR7/pH-response regulator pali n=1 Tax=Lipomyces japonicus TaxID=56871 RepID=UPI0034D011E3